MPTLLLADDSVTIRRFLELTFADEGIRVVAVADGEQAIAHLDADPPDIVLADISMPRVSGYDVAARVKRSRALRHIPVLLLTSAFEPVDERRARATGCVGVLIKPFEPQQLVGWVRDVLGGHRPAALWPAHLPGTGGILDRTVQRYPVPFPEPKPKPEPVIKPTRTKKVEAPAEAPVWRAPTPPSAPAGAAPDPAFEASLDLLDTAFAPVARVVNVDEATALDFAKDLAQTRGSDPSTVAAYREKLGDWDVPVPAPPVKLPPRHQEPFPDRERPFGGMAAAPPALAPPAPVPPVVMPPAAQAPGLAARLKHHAAEGAVKLRNVMALDAHSFAELPQALALLEDGLQQGAGVLSAGVKVKMRTGLAGSITECQDVGFVSSAKGLGRLQSQLDRPDCTVEEIVELLFDLGRRLQDDAELSVALLIPAPTSDLYRTPLKGWEPVLEQFQSLEADIEEANRCLAVGRYMATVFHLSRVMDVGLDALARALDVPDANWTSLLTVLDQRVVRAAQARKPAPGSRPNASDKQIRAKTARYLRDVQGAWGRTDMHDIRPVYDADKALDVLTAVRAFMCQVADHVRR